MTNQLDLTAFFLPAAAKMALSRETTVPGTRAAARPYPFKHCKHLKSCSRRPDRRTRSASLSDAFRVRLFYHARRQSSNLPLFHKSIRYFCYFQPTRFLYPHAKPQIIFRENYLKRIFALIYHYFSYCILIFENFFFHYIFRTILCVPYSATY